MDTNFISGGDKTTGNGNMLVINGATSNNQVFGQLVIMEELSWIDHWHNIHP
ncbi:hypothetical protein ACFQZF_15075 [Flavobacterium myungsuense]|uniref:hypothetical protein n=1 Tax=Flavobacterium myungsuense TaxID=651823 RepID=UPI00362689EF